nr:AAA family ATPase [Rhodococcus sp. (in: high G+C Gram-positive bacteria)]
MNSWQPVRPAEPEEQKSAPDAVSEPEGEPAATVGDVAPTASAVVDDDLAPSDRTAAQPAPPFRSTPVNMPADHAPRPRESSAAHTPPSHTAGPLLPPVAAASALDLTNALLVRPVSPAPASGWRRWLHTVTGGGVNLGNSARDERLLRLTQQVDRHLVGCYRIAVLSLKGGVGKTTTTATLGSTFANVRGDRVIAVDANPDRGTLSQKVPLETPATVRNMLRDIDTLTRYSDVRAYTSQNQFRLEVLASDTDPAVSEAFSGQDYDKTVALLEKFYSIVLTDCGTGLMHSAMSSILEGSDALVVVSSSSVDGARSASATLDWLDAHGHRDLVSSSVAVVNAVRPRAGKVDLAKVVEHFEQRCRQVVLVPFDPHLEEGAEIDLNRLKRRTRAALLELAAAMASGFPSNRPDDMRRAHELRTGAPK